MRAITKGDGHYRLKNCQNNYLAELATGKVAIPTNAWRNFQHLEATVDACLGEQFGLCAFSEVVLDDNDLGMHLDHIEPKSLNPARTFDHTNLLLCAISSERLQYLPRSDVFGGQFQ